MKTYEKYKSSRIEWIGDIPEHWDMKKVSRSFNTIGSGTTPTAGNPVYYTDGTIDWINTGDLNDGILTNCKKKITKQAFDEFSTLKIYSKGTLLIAMYGATIGKVSLLDFEACTNQACCALSDSPIFNQKYLLYWFLSNKPHIINLSYGGGQPNISQDIVKSLKITFPPIAEQTAIADYLDEQTEQIDKLIANKERLIELLKEERTAIINKAVTKGINPDAKLKPSGIDWLGDIPEHWEVVSLNYRFDVQLGKMLDAKRITGKKLAPYLRNVDVQWGKINTEDLPLMDFSEADKEKYSIKNDDLLVCEGGEIGRCAIWTKEDVECFYQKALHRVRPIDSEKDFVNFLFYLMFIASKRGLFSATGNSSTIEHLPAEKLKKHRFPFPPIEEQKEIVEFIESKTNEIDSTISKIEKEIELIKEYRTALISEVVTGKIKITDN